MSGIRDTSLSVLSWAFSTRTATKVPAGAIVFILVVYGIRCASPIGSARILVEAITETEKAYLEALEASVLPKGDIHTAEMAFRCAPSHHLLLHQCWCGLQLKVSTIREVSLQNSLTYRGALCEIFTGRTFTVLECLRHPRA
jgi:hypothetical protein